MKDWKTCGTPAVATCATTRTHASGTSRPSSPSASERPTRESTASKGAAWSGAFPDPADRRSSLLELTDTGTQLVHEADETFAAIGALVQTALDPAQALRQLLTALEHDRIGTPAG
ncbi:MarR family winged helix-turn-helix transcriptional regulator [Amycolatopsis coloradensis]|uniref:MarR family winged helix-turn-helix transcriptional regulator n=1 Tax=Amycolatopsis coloradensis TaxID=76021 RepID=A0ACD5BH92_9PSEU